jgi:hypothetical protein
MKYLFHIFIIILLSSTAIAEIEGQEYLDCVSKKIFEECNSVSLEKIQEKFYKAHSGINHFSTSIGTMPVTCGAKNFTLTYSFGKYFYEEIPIECPTIEQIVNKTTFGDNSPIVETHGESSPITIGNNSPINQNESNMWFQLFWSKGTIACTIIGAILTFLLPKLYKRYFKKRKAKTS